MEIKEIQDLQKRFDMEYFKNFWEAEDEKSKIEKLQYLVVALTGEIGEYANIVKKISRDLTTLGINTLDERKNELTEELIDCFIYIIITANLLGMDLEKEYLKKMEKNKQRFQKYKKD
ncbi:MAG: MazG nucleotide pyrophosphohydrolase domain-containing protein [Candidatus Aenigmatarchaeota archaeon]